MYWCIRNLIVECHFIVALCGVEKVEKAMSLTGAKKLFPEKKHNILFIGFSAKC